jgi:hypothetical protein
LSNDLSILPRRLSGWPSLVATATFIVTFLRLGAIPNDQYIYLARAHQMLAGDWPVRDFVDPGFTLHYVLPALAARLGGPTLLSDAVLWVLLFAVTTAVTLVLSRRASGSLVLGLLAAALVALFPPRLYNVSKALVPAVAIALAWRCADRRRPLDVAMLGAWTGVAFLFRFDYSLYIAAASIVMLVIMRWPAAGPAARSILVYALAALVIVLPWLMYVQAEEGLAAFLASALRFAAAERARTESTWPAVYYAITAVPIVVLAGCARGTRTLTTAHVAFAATLTLLSDLALLRDAPGARLPDVYATTIIVTAIAFGRWMPAPRHRFASLPRPAIAVILLMAVAGAAAGFPRVWSRWTLVATRLRDARPDITPAPERAALVQFIERCTAPDDRIFVGGFAPELPVLAHRPFAGGAPQWLRGYYTDRADVARARTQLARERVGVAVMLDGGDAFTSTWPAIAADLRARGLVTYLFPQTPRAIELWLPPSPVADADTGLPCHHESRGPS